MVTLERFRQIVGGINLNWQDHPVDIHGYEMRSRSTQGIIVALLVEIVDRLDKQARFGSGLTGVEAEIAAQRGAVGVYKPTEQDKIWFEASKKLTEKVQFKRWESETVSCLQSRIAELEDELRTVREKRVSWWGSIVKYLLGDRKS